MNKIPAFDIKTNKNYHPHVVILGAGASYATFPNGDKNGKKLPLMNDLVSCVGLENELAELGVENYDGNFESLFEDLNKNQVNHKSFKRIKEKIHSYFENLCLPDELTIYDKLLLSLREKDIIATFNWDPLLALAFQRNRKIKKLPKIVFLHGNTFVGICSKHNTTGFINTRCSKCGGIFKKVELLYPIKDKNYDNDPFIRNEWEILRHHIKYAFMLTIFGYSAPKTDINAREILLNGWSKNEIKNFAQIEIIDVKKEKELVASWEEFFVRNHYSLRKSFNSSFISYFPRRTCEAMASAYLQNDPWNYQEEYKGTDLFEYQNWILKVIESEIENEKNEEKSLFRW